MNNIGAGCWINTVMPAKAGIQEFKFEKYKSKWIPAFAGMTNEELSSIGYTESSDEYREPS